MRSLIFSTGCLPGRVPLSERIEQFLKAGVSGIELGQGVTVPEGIVWSDFQPMASTWTIHNYFPPPKKDFLLNLAEDAMKNKNQSLDFCLRALDVATAIGADIYSVHGGFRSDIPVKELGNPIVTRECLTKEAAFDNLVAAFSVLLKKAEKTGIQILVEPNVLAGFNLTEEVRNQLMMVDADELVAFLKALSHPLLGILLDMGHLKVTANVLGFDPLEYVAAIESHIRAFHYHDNDGQSDQHRFSLPQGWMKQVLQKKSLLHLPVIVESHFQNGEELSHGRREMEAILS